jgi:dihydrolipoamide dehydrogenase
MSTDVRTDVAIIGAGTAGLYAVREVRRARKSFVLIDQGPLGTTCARVGCMPSKSALHAATLWSGRRTMGEFGIQGGAALKLDRTAAWQAVRSQRDRFAGKTASATREIAGQDLVEGRARFVEPSVLEVRTGADERRIVRAGAVVIATGSRPILLDWLEPVAAHVVTTDQLFELDTLPASAGVLGLGAIGLEMGLALARLGVRVVGAELAEAPAGITDPALAERAVPRLAQEMTLWLGEAARVSLRGERVVLTSGAHDTEVELLLAALGRRPNTAALGLAEAGLPVDEHGTPLFNPATLQVGELPIFIAGDGSGYRPLMHEAADEGAIAGYNAAREHTTRFRRRVPLSIAFSDPDIAFVGERWDHLDADATLVGTASGEANGRSVILGASESLLRVYADAGTGQLRGAALMASGGEHLAHLLAWAIQRGETVRSLLQMPFYHPTVEELVQSALLDIARRLPPGPDDLPVGLRAE